MNRCYDSNINYTYYCKRCKKSAEEGDDTGDEGGSKEVAQYRGETSRSAFERHKGHLETLRSKKESWMLEHARDTHAEALREEGVAAALYGMKVEPRDKDSMRRILREAIRIKKALGGERMIIEGSDGGRKEAKIKLLNSKREFYLPSIVEVSVGDRGRDL